MPTDSDNENFSSENDGNSVDITDIHIYGPDKDDDGRIIQSTDLIVEPQCHICSSPFRLAADQLYIDSIDPKTGRGVYAVIKHFLEKKTGKEVWWNSCMLHATKHIRTKYDDDLIITYGDKLLDVQGELKESDAQIDIAIASLFERLYKLGSYTNTDSLVRDVEITKGIAMVSDRLSKLWSLKNEILQTASEEVLEKRLIAILTNILSNLPEEYHEVVREEIKKLKM